jgi:hypothetical protein
MNKKVINQVIKKRRDANKEVNRRVQEAYIDYEPEYKRMKLEPFVQHLEDKETSNMYAKKNINDIERENAQKKFNNALASYNSGKITEQQLKGVANGISKELKHRLESNDQQANTERNGEGSVPPRMQATHIQSKNTNKSKGFVQPLRPANPILASFKVPQGNYQLPQVSDDIGDNHLWAKGTNLEGNKDLDISEQEVYNKDLDISEQEVYNEGIDYDEVDSYEEDTLTNVNKFSVGDGEYSLLYDNSVVFSGAKVEVEELIEELLKGYEIKKEQIIVVKKVGISFGCSLNE